MKIEPNLMACYLHYTEEAAMGSKTTRFHDNGAPLEIHPVSWRRQDLVPLSFYYIGFSRIRNLIFRFFKMPVARILAFHDVPDHLLASFRAKLEVLKEQANVISLDDFFNGKMSWRKINVAITFDDGYRSWLDYVSPVLRDLGVNATFFVSSGFVGRRKTEETNFLRNNLKSNLQTTGCIGVEGVRKLVEEGFTIGGHTSNHVNLAELCDKDVLRDEIQKDKEELERITGTRVKYFAYPFGFYRNAHIDLERVVQDSGYRGAVTTVPGFNTASTNTFLLRRDLVNASMPMTVFKARLSGSHDSMMFVREILRLKHAGLDIP
jgi:peptidoglycan/xylan/chitin deacetylase (PgdA/CDA1 family)